MMAGLAKQANGLPRFMMDCGWWRNGRKWRRRTLAELGLQMAGVSFANEHSTDGVVPGPAEELAEALSLPLADVKRTVPKLIERGVWRKRDDDDFEIVDFLDHNPSRAEVVDDRRKKAEKAAKANHQRWHVEKKMTDPDCPYCIPQGSSDESSDDSQDESYADSQWKEGRKDGWMDGSSSLSSSSNSRPPAERVDDGQRVEAALKAITDKRVADHATKPIPNMAGYRRAVAAGVTKDFKPSAYLLAHQHPDWPPERLAVTLDPPDKPKLAVVQATENTRLGGIAQWLAEGTGA